MNDYEIALKRTDFKFVYVVKKKYTFVYVDIALKRADFKIDDVGGGSFKPFICTLAITTPSSSVSTDRLWPRCPHPREFCQEGLHPYPGRAL